MRDRIVVEQLDQAARGHGGLGHVTHRPGHVHVGIDIVVQVDLRQRMVLIGRHQAGFAGVVHHQYQCTLGLC